MPRITDFIHGRGPNENGPRQGAISYWPSRIRLVVPVMVTPNHHRSVTIAIVPAAMPATIVSVELGSRAAIAVAVTVAVATDAEAKSLGASHGRRSNRDGR